MVFVAGKHITNVNEFSSDFHTILNLISDGYAWLNWALTDPSLSVYYAQNEQDLLTKIQNGLHETSLLRCDAFTLDIEKAMSLEDPDLELLTEVFEKNATETAAVTSLSQRYALVTNAQLNEADTILCKNDIENAAVFQGLNFSERLELFQFQDGLRNNSLTQEAIKFGMQKAASASEFIHYTNFYLNCAQHQLKSNTPVKARPQTIQGIYNQLSNLCFSLIYVPNIGSFDSHEAMAEHLQDFVTATKFIGYRIKATAMENLAKNIQIYEVAEDELKTNIENYMASIKEKVSQEAFTVDMIPQDGGLLSFTSTTEQFQVVIQVNKEGEVCLSPKTQLNTK